MRLASILKVNCFERTKENIGRQSALPEALNYACVKMLKRQQKQRNLVNDLKNLGNSDSPSRMRDILMEKKKNELQSETFVHQSSSTFLSALICMQAVSRASEIPSLA
jgi:hypothetical protein